jgi:hypothetical protein
MIDTKIDILMLAVRLKEILRYNTRFYSENAD